MKRIFGLALAALLCGTAALAGGAVYANEDTGVLPDGSSVAAVSDGIPLPTASAEDESGVPSPDVSGEYVSPLVTLRADPYLYKHEGTYYFTGSYPEYDRIELTCADSVNGVAAAVPKTIWTAPNANSRNPDGSVDEYYKYVWAPEIHYIMDTWVVYFAYSQGSLWDIRCCALKLNGTDPMHDEWEYMGVMEKTADDGFSFASGMSLDMTVYENDGNWYAIWAQKPGSSNLYIAQLETPFKLATSPVLITQPDYDWERGGNDAVDEGPAVLKHGGKIFVSFSGSTTGASYCMGLLEIDACDDPLDASNWKKYAEPVFKTDASLKIYGPGHNCFVEGDNGEPLCILHFRDYRDISGDSLLDYNRHAHVMKITFDRHGIPQFHLDKDELYNSDYHNN